MGEGEEGKVVAIFKKRVVHIQNSLKNMLCQPLLKKPAVMKNKKKRDQKSKKCFFKFKTLSGSLKHSKSHT